MLALAQSAVPFATMPANPAIRSGSPDSARLQPLSFFSAGSEIYAQGEKVGSYYQVEFGAVRVYRLLSDGRRQITAFHLAGEIFGFEADYTHHFFAEAIVATGLRTFRPVAGVDMSRELLPLALRGMVRAQKHLLVVGRQTAVERIAAFLIDMAVRQGEPAQVELPMSRHDIGDYLRDGVAPSDKIARQGSAQIPRSAHSRNPQAGNASLDVRVSLSLSLGKSLMARAQVTLA